MRSSPVTFILDSLLTKENIEALIKENWIVELKYDGLTKNKEYLFTDYSSVPPNCKKFTWGRYIFIIDTDGKPRYIRKLTCCKNAAIFESRFIKSLEESFLLKVKAVLANVYLSEVSRISPSLPKKVENFEDKAPPQQKVETSLASNKVGKFKLNGLTQNNEYIFADYSIVPPYSKKFTWGALSFIIDISGAPRFIRRHETASEILDLQIIKSIETNCFFIIESALNNSLSYDEVISMTEVTILESHASKIMAIEPKPIQDNTANTLNPQQRMLEAQTSASQSLQNISIKAKEPKIKPAKRKSSKHLFENEKNLSTDEQKAPKKSNAKKKKS